MRFLRLCDEVVLLHPGVILVYNSSQPLHFQGATEYRPRKVSSVSFPDSESATRTGLIYCRCLNDPHRFHQTGREHRRRRTHVVITNTTDSGTVATSTATTALRTPGRGGPAYPSHDPVVPRVQARSVAAQAAQARPQIEKLCTHHCVSWQVRIALPIHVVSLSFALTPLCRISARHE